MIFDAPKTVLLEIDVQNDFCPAYTADSGEKRPAGALAVNLGDQVIQPLNTLAAALVAAGGRVVATQDWHPLGHVSFASSHAGKNMGDTIATEKVKEQVLWPDHCVQGTHGATFHDKLDLRPISLVIRKGYNRELDSYSAFFENDRKTPTGLEGWLKGLGITRIIAGGLATDYCVFYSVMDALTLGFEVIVASDAVYGVDYPQGSVEKAVEAMKKAGAVFTSSQELLKEIK